MNDWLTLFSGPWVHDWLCALAHTLWQALLIGGLLALVLRRVSVQKTTLRYGLTVGAMLWVVMLGSGTLAVMRLEGLETPASGSTRPAEGVHETTPPAAVAAVPPLPSSPAVSSTPQTGPVSWGSILLIGWLLGVTVMLVRILVQLTGAGRVTRDCRPVTEPHLLQLIDRLKRMLGITCRVMAVAGDRVVTPAVIGCWRPVILLPVSLLSAVPQEDLEAILLHELAHIKRYDYLVNFFQMVIEALLFFNPALWWISHQIRLEREACCDAVAVQHSGQRLRYAEILMQWAQSDRIKSPLAGAALALSDNKESPLVERIRRIALPGQRSAVRFSGLGMISLFVISALVLAALWKTTDTAVVYAAHWLNASEREQVIDEIDQQYGYQAITQGKENQITLSGTVRSADGIPLPDRFYIHSMAQSGISSLSSGTWVTEGSFRETMDYHDVVYLIVERSEYAPAFVGPFHPTPGESIDSIEIVLDQGFAGVIEVVNQQGDPIPGAQLEGHYNLFENFWSGSQRLTDLVTDNQGQVLLAHAIDRSMTLDVLAPGYQLLRKAVLQVEPNQPGRLVLTASQPTTGRVLAQATGLPVADAKVRLWRDHTGQSYMAGRGEVWATTDPDGRFTLTSLAQGQAYAFIIESPDYQWTRVTGLTMGRQDGTVYLEPKHHIRGKMLGTPTIDSIYDSTSKRWIKLPVLKYSYGYQDEYSYDSGQVPLEGAGREWTFELFDVYGDTVRFDCGDKEVRVSLDRDTDNLVLDRRPLSERGLATGAVRPVVFQFPTIDGFDCNDYQLSVSCVSQADRDAGQWGQWNKHPIENNRVEVLTPVPGRVSYSRGGFDPYRDVGEFLRAFWIEGEHQIPVPAGSEPFIIDVPLYPAGAIYGQIQVADGSMTAGHPDVDLVLWVVDWPADLTPLHQSERSLPHQGAWGPVDKYTLSPVPLNGTYIILAKYRYGWVKSPAIHLTESQAVADYPLVFPVGIDLTGTIQDTQGHPIPNISISLQFSTRLGQEDWNSSHYMSNADAQGRFCFEGVNPEIEGTYELEVTGNVDYQPFKMKVRPRTRPYRITLEPAESIVGTVVDSQGHPVSGVRVMASEVQKKWTQYGVAQSLPCDSQGRFEIKGLKSKTTYRLQVKDHHVVRQPELRADRNPSVRLVLTDHR